MTTYVLQFHGHDGLGDAPHAVPTAASVTISASQGLLQSLAMHNVWQASHNTQVAFVVLTKQPGRALYWPIKVCQAKKSRLLNA